MINKAKFKYTKNEGSISERTVLQPLFLKESKNSIVDFYKPDVKYLHGIEIQKDGLTQLEIEKYEKLITEYYEIKFPTLEEFINQNGLDASKIVQKSFKKEGITDLTII